MLDWDKVVSGVVGGLAVFAVQQLKRVWEDRRDSRVIYKWLLEESQKPDKFDHRSTRAISKAVSLPPDRVTTLCYLNKKIHPALGKREDLWNLDGKNQRRSKNFFEMDDDEQDEQHI